MRFHLLVLKYGRTVHLELRILKIYETLVKLSGANFGTLCSLNNKLTAIWFEKWTYHVHYLGDLCTSRYSYLGFFE